MLFLCTEYQHVIIKAVTASCMKNTVILSDEKTAYSNTFK